MKLETALDVVAEYAEGARLEGLKRHILIGPAPEDALVATGVGKNVNSVRNDDPACVMPAAHDAGPAQRSLF